MIYRLPDKKIEIDQNTFIAPSADIVGDVKIGKFSSVWFGCTIRGDGFPVEIGEYTNIQDNSVIHVTTDKFAAILGNHVTVGHNAVIHGATLKDYSFVGISATVLDNAVVEPFGFVAAGALVTPGFVVPEKTLVAGVPARIIRPLKESEIEGIKHTALDYSERAMYYVQNLKT
ncbi:MAG: gamma carbonic anhydrase family protein [Leptospirales bacterium]